MKFIFSATVAQNTPITSTVLSAKLTGMTLDEEHPRKNENYFGA